MKALMIVDVQNDFCPGGKLGVKDGDKVVPVINNLMEAFDLVIASQDWHPEDTVHFKKWPPHCIKHTVGAAFHPDLHVNKVDQFLKKGTGNADDGYSAFEATNIDLLDYLRQRKVETLYIAGLTTEFCVKDTAIDATKKGFNTIVVEDAIKPVEQKPGDADKAKSEMRKAGVKFTSAEQLAQKKAAP